MQSKGLSRVFSNTMIIEMLKELGIRMNEHSIKFSKEIEYIKKQTELKSKINENALEGLNSRVGNRGLK